MWSLLKLNEHVARMTKQPVTVVNVVSCLVFSIIFGHFYRIILHPRRVPPSVRHLVGLSLGFAFGWLCLKSDLLILVLICALCYILTCKIHPTAVHKVVFGVSFSILLVAQIYRMVLSYGTNHFDYTGRLMVIVQRLTYVAFSLHDGVGRKESELNDEQKKDKIEKPPSILEYFGYMFHYSGFLVGPSCTYVQYIDFIEGKDIERARSNSKGKRKDPSPWKFIRTKLLSSAFFAVGFGLISPRFNITLNGDPDFIGRTSFLRRIWYAWVSIAALRFKYYLAFALGELGLVSCGLGFSGYDEEGNEEWENARNLNAWNVEFPTSLKMVVDNWNVSTAKWLRRTVHARVPYQKAALTFATSVIWHGLYPGYFLVATASLLLNQVSKAVRRAYGHVYNDLSSIGQQILLLLQIAVNILLLTYCTIPFPLLTFDLGYQFFKSMHFFGHIVCCLGLVFFYMRSQPRPKPKEPTLSTSNTNHVIKPELQLTQERNGARLLNNNPLHLRQNQSHFKGSF
ncbi:lysophospholipid acyltransferase 1-like [Actinia tenebrosa]|uniref:Lysophospholipid acyltransferase 1-like n=1 Tax=Actinia tenebrosa TaxID=6105 RepID=A0A6P8HQS8_ACTTE|nr:lysophospholipid acyltransferase 1-like [Actinia tenebrosa]